MARWFTADLHLGHAHVLRYTRRPFADISVMDDLLMERINERVADGDELWVLGDVAGGRLPFTLLPLRRLRCKVVIVAGNHDKIHPAHASSVLQWAGLYREWSGAVELHLHPRVIELRCGTRLREVLVAHHPYTGPDGSTVGRWRPRDLGKWLLCGHVHEKWRQRGRQINVGVDAWGFAPVSEEELYALVAAGPADREVLAWPPELIRPPL